MSSLSAASRVSRNVLALASAGILAGALRSPAPASAEPAAADSILSIRGTEEPLHRDAMVLRRTARVVLAVPYFASQVVLVPVAEMAYLEKRYQVLHTLSRFLVWGGGTEETQFHLQFGFESSTGISIVGISASAENWLGTGSRFDLGGGYVGPDRSRAELSFRSAPAPFQIQGLAQFEAQPERPFYGLGPGSAEKRYDYDRERRLLEIGALYGMDFGLRAGLSAYLRGQDLAVADEGPSIANGFPGLYAPAEKTAYAGLEASVVLDRRDRGPFSRKGALLRVTGGVDDARRSGAGNYRHYEAEAQAFAPLFWKNRILALRVSARGVDAGDPGAIPFTELEALGGKHGLRGYPRNRFVDRNALLLTAEYRYPITNHLDGRLIADWGSVAPEWSRMRLADVDPSFGIGVALDLPNWPMTLQVNHSPESTEFYLGTEAVFSYRSRRDR